MMGINVRIDRAARVDYAGCIMLGWKTLESRATDSLRPYVGKRVAIVRTGAGRAHAIGTVRIMGGWKVPACVFRMLEAQHRVPEGSRYDVRPGGHKWVYLLAEPRMFDAPRAVGKGIVAREVLGPIQAPEGGPASIPWP